MRICQRIYKTWLIGGIVVVTLMYITFAFFYDLNLDALQFRKFNFASLTTLDDAPIPPNRTTKTILFWNTMFGDETFSFGEGDIFGKCQGVARNCWSTHDRSIINVEDFDAILYHGSELNPSDVPSRRRQRQYYIFVNLESPENRPIKYSQFNNDFFNLTMTYRLDSDVVWSYADVREIKGASYVAPRRETVWSFRKATDLKGTSLRTADVIGNTKDALKIRRKKTKSAVWFVSNCQSRSGREKYVDELKLHIDVDIYGLCGKEVRCPTNRDCFREVVEPEYYFYLSFENSMCQDYVTEKLYRALQYDVIPVVHGGANYSLFAPPGSYINALDFDSPKDLAIYLRRLIARPTEYDKYFAWKKTYTIVKSNDRVICQLCEYLNVRNDTKTYSPLSTWYTSGKCPLQHELKKVPYVTRRNLRN